MSEVAVISPQLLEEQLVSLRGILPAILFWFFGNKIGTARAGDVNGLSAWRTASREEVATLLRVREGESRADKELTAFTRQQLEKAGFSIPQTEHAAGGGLKEQLPHHSLRPSTAPGGNVNLTPEQISQLNSTPKPSPDPSLKNIRPKNFPECR